MSLIFVSNFFGNNKSSLYMGMHCVFFLGVWAGWRIWLRAGLRIDSYAVSIIVTLIDYQQYTSQQLRWPNQNFLALFVI